MFSHTLTPAAYILDPNVTARLDNTFKLTYLTFFLALHDSASLDIAPAEARIWHKQGVEDGKYRYAFRDHGISSSDTLGRGGAHFGVRERR